MRVFSVESDGGFTEYERLPFEVDHEESVLEEWLESDLQAIKANPAKPSAAAMERLANKLASLRLLAASADQGA